MESYEVLATYYDRFTDDVGYVAWADYIEKIFEKENVNPKLILDLACGTGSLTAILANRGYDMIGVDASSEMLTQAFSNVMDIENRPLLLNQRMENLELYGTVDAVVCCLDSVNYVTDKNALKHAIKRVYESLEPNGIFIFDINTEKKFKDIAGTSYVREDGDVYCVWQCIVDGDICTYDFDIFELTEDNLWVRNKETHEERIYKQKELENWLCNAGFIDIKVYKELSFENACDTEHRLFFVAKKGETN